MQHDIFTIEIIKDTIVALGEEMFNAMIRTSMSPIIYETTDFAVGATDATGNLLAQGNGVTAFLATLDTAVVSLSNTILIRALFARGTCSSRIPLTRAEGRTFLTW